MTFWICATCAVESAEQFDVCAICADERQWVPASGQRWTTLEELREQGYRAQLEELEPDLHAITSSPSAGIGQQSKLLVTSEGSLLWDPIGFLDDAVVERILALGPVRAITASHPHMYGVQVEWSRALGGPPVLVAEADARWINRPDPVIRDVVRRARGPAGRDPVAAGRPLPRQRDRALGGRRGRQGRAAERRHHLRQPRPARPSRSCAATRTTCRCPVRSPAGSPTTSTGLEFDRLYGNFANVIATDAKEVVRRSADRHIGWANGDFDHLT